MNKAEIEKAEKELKAKHGTVYTLTVPISEDEKQKATIFLRKMDRLCYQSVSKLMAKDELMAVESLLKTLHVGGDKVELITDNFDALRAAANSVVEIIQAKEGVLKKN